jgi:glyoxylase-like metal-dependent hydrolase (beta-lactamase superfamily II)
MLFFKYNIEITCHEQELIWIDMFEDTCKRYGLKTTNTPPTPTNLINEGEVFRFGNTELKAIHVPGHSAGSLVFHNTKDNVIFCGDVIFQNSIGRTDLPGGNYNQLLTNIKTKLLTLPKETLILPGHGDNTTIGTEKSENPFLI